MKTKKTLNKFCAKLQKLEDEIQEIADECTPAEGETDMAETLWTAHSDIISARQTLDEF